MKKILEIVNLSAKAEDKEIIKDLNLEIKEGEIHVLMGPNGAGKSTLGNVILGNNIYEVTKGDIYFDEEKINDLKTDERAKKGLFLSFQSPVEIPGVTISQFLRTAMDATSTKRLRLKEYKNILNEKLNILGINESWINRELNVGFSGGERKKIEMLQLHMLSPKLAILDETDSGLDVDAVKTVSKGIESFCQNKDKSLLIITHNTKILEHLNVDKVHIIVKGTIIKTGDKSLIDTVNKFGYEPFMKEIKGE